MPQVKLAHLHLAPKHLTQLQALLAAHLPEHIEVWAYGSRVTGCAHEGSDLDIVLRNQAELTQSTEEIFELKNALQESLLPILIDVHDWAHLPASFHSEIEKTYVVIREAKPSSLPVTH